MQAGVDKLASVVGVTLGPKVCFIGRCTKPVKSLKEMTHSELTNDKLAYMFIPHSIAMSLSQGTRS